MNDLAPPSFRSAIDLFERLFALHETARVDLELQEFKALAAGKMRPYAGKRGSFRKVPPASIWPRNFTPRQLAMIKLRWPELLSLPEPGAPPPTPAQLAKGIAEMKSAIFDLLADGMFPSERRVKAMLDAKLDTCGPFPVDQQTVGSFAALSGNDRYAAIDAYYRHRADGKDAIRAAADFLPHQVRWRKKQSFQACRTLSYVEQELADPLNFSPAQLKLLETRYHATALPPFPHHRYIGTRTARLAIAIEASVQVRPNSQILRLDLELAHQIAKKFNAFQAIKFGGSPLSAYSRLI